MILSAELASQGQAAALATSTRTPTVTPTLTPITGALQKQLVFSGLGAGPGPFPCTKAQLKNTRTPAIVELERSPDEPYPWRLYNRAGLCIFGIPFHSGFTVDLYKPDGKLADQVTYRQGDSYPDDDGVTIWSMQPVGAARNYPIQEATDLNGLPAIYLSLWEPMGLTEGRWHLRLSADNNALNADFNVTPFPQIPVVLLDRSPKWRFPNASPLDNPQEQYVTITGFDKPLKPGDTLKLYGANFTPGSMPLIGVYFASNNQTGETGFVRQINTRVDRNGEWNFIYSVPLDDPVGYYYIVVVLNPGTDTGEDAGITIDYRIASWHPCPDTYASQFSPGMRAKVIEGQKANRLRSQPTTNGSNIIGSIPAGQPFDILDGPRCANNWVWWYVSAPNGKTGWTAEGDENERWLEPTR